MVNDYRHYDDVKKMYKQRPQHIERVFVNEKKEWIKKKTF